ncbi:S41 family peptidase [Balneola sp. MJW-20]|uniref:S41 family peptidase n=1 Tax=Gracilimonas aurantiaca TaxID=3234185 RepID=UPI00346662F3
MTLKKLILPGLLTFLFLAGLKVSGVEPVFEQKDPTTHLTKYIQAQRYIVSNYFGNADLNELYKSSIKYMVRSLSDSTMKVDGTPIDTLFKGLNVTSLTESASRFQNAYLYISNNNEEEDMGALTEQAIRGMFSTLDPHSIYIEPEDNEQIQEEFAGKFQGIGVQFNIIQDTITVITAIAGGPSDQLGIRSGDRIIEIEDSTSVGFTNEMVLRRLRGEKGSKVNVTIKRPNVSEPLYFTITRDDIPLYTVDTSYMLDEQTGYIKINRFAATTHQEFMQAMTDLKSVGMERLVLDLRGNPGGYLTQAIAIAEEFFPVGTELVSTKSKHSRFNGDYSSRKNGAFKDKPVIILVDEGAASASEIVSGAIQDHDRGLIVGKRTFGKGLVQQQYELIDESSVRVTISRYYTPSGRLIQKPFTEGGKEDYAYEIYRREEAQNDAVEFIDHVPDSLKFTTDAGRTVYGGGGIIPDYIIPEDTTVSAYVINFAIREQASFDFVRNFLDNKGDAFRAEWGGDFQNFRDNFQWSEEDKKGIKEMLIERGMAISDTVKTPRFTRDSLYIPEGHFEENSWLVEGRMKAELARQAWDMTKFYPIINDVFDTTIEEAMKLWDAVARLEALAQSGGTSSSEGK